MRRNRHMRVADYFADASNRHTCKLFFEGGLMLDLHFTQEAAVRFAEQPRRRLVGIVGRWRSVELNFYAMPAGKSHLRCRRGQAAFAQIMTRPDQSRGNHAMDCGECVASA